MGKIKKLENMLNYLLFLQFVKGQEGRETTELLTNLNNWDMDRRFVISRVLKSEQDRVQLSLVEGDEYEY